MTKPPKPIKDEIASAERDIFRDYIGKTLLNPDKVLRSESGGKGIELFEDLLTDDKVGSTLQTRRLAVVGKEWEIIPASERRQDQKIADYVKQVFLKFDYDAARRALLAGLVTGFKPGEVMWEYSEGDVWIKEIIGRSPRRFVFGTDRRMRLLTLQNLVEGEEIPECKFVVFTNQSDNGSPYGDGLGRQLYWPVWFKKNAIKFWMIFSDKFGSPTALGKYPPGTLKPQQDKLLEVLEAIQTESCVTIPNNLAVEFLEAERTASVNNYESLCRFMNGAIAQVMLGQTLTSEIAGAGSYAASKTHEGVRQDYIKADADALCESQNNQLVRWIVDYNFPGVKEYPKVWIRTEPEADLKALADRDKILLVDMGVPMTKKYVYDTYGIPEPQEGEELVMVPSPTPQALGPEDTRKIDTRKTTSFADPIETESADWVTRYMSTLAPSLKDARQGALAEIEAWLLTLPSPPLEADFIARIEGILGPASAAVDATAITDAVTDIYLAYRSAPGITAAFGGPDIRSMRFLADLDQFYVSRYLRNPDAQVTVKNFLSQTYLEKGASLFKRSDPADLQAFKDLLGQKLSDLEEWQVRRIIDTSVQRTRNWASVAQLNEAGIEELEVYEPTMDCAFCRAINGRIIRVSAAYSRMTAQAGMTPAEYEMDMRQFPATERNIDILVNGGHLPPYHPHCHGTVLRRMI